MFDVRGRKFRLFFAEEFLNKVGTVHLSEETEDVLTFRGLVPEEELTLGKLFFLCLCRPDGLEGVRMDACVPCFCGNRHGGRREVLYLFELEIEVFGQYCQLCHIFSGASWMGTDEIGDDLLTQMLLAVQIVEDALEVIEKLEGRFAHE